MRRLRSLGPGFTGWAEQLCHRLDLHVAVLQLPGIVLFQQTTPISRIIDASLEKSPPLQPPLDLLVQRSSGFMLWTFARCCSRTSRCDKTSVSLSSMNPASFGHFCRS